ncbi:MAG TPA: hypothetical protein VF411_10765 [Bacteroidia bacterium]
MKRIPLNIIKFFALMQSSCSYLIAPSPPPFTNLNWQRLNWLPAELAAWQAFFAQLNPLYIIYSANPRGNPVNTKSIHAIIKAVRLYDKINHMLDRIAAGSPTVTNINDFIMFNIKHNSPVVGSGMLTERHVATINQVWIIAKGVGGAVIHYEARADKSSKRASKLKGYNLGIVYLILNATDVAPVTTNLLTTSTVSTKANHTLNLLEETVGKRVAMSFYWKHKTNAALDGPKSNIIVVIIA